MVETGDRRRIGVLGVMGVHPAQRLSGASRRVLAYLAVKGPRVSRSLTCLQLWPDVAEERARANLRRALWQSPTGWIEPVGPDLVLDARIDLHDAQRVAARALQGEVPASDEVALLGEDLLPGWYEEWLLVEQDRFHLTRIQALESVCRTATSTGDLSLATTAGLAAVCAEPLRESAVRVLVEALIEEGNRFEAVRRYRSYRALLLRELDAEPGPDLAGLVAGVAGVTGTRDPH